MMSLVETSQRELPAADGGAALGEGMGEGMRVGVLGAGAIGTFVGAALAAKGYRVILVGRRPLAAEIETSGFVLTDLDGGEIHLAAKAVPYATSPAALANCDVILCCVKSGQTLQAGRELAGVIHRSAIVVSLQNGLGNADALRSVLPHHVVLGGIVGFNVVLRDGGVYRRTTSGPLVVEASPDDRVNRLAGALKETGLEVKVSSDIRSLQWAKLLLNLNNAVSALSDVPTADLLVLPGYRRVIRAIVTEALDVMRKAGIRPGNLTGLPAGAFRYVLRLPTPVLRVVAATQLKIDPQARSSMWEDLSKRRATEVDYLNGEIVRLAASAGTRAPLNARIVELVHHEEKRAAGSPRFSADELWQRLTAAQMATSRI
jgi:2-dehydropantoate 2-reductase